MVLSLSSKIFVTWYCKKLQNLFYFQSQVIFVSFQDCHQSTVEIRQCGADTIIEKRNIHFVFLISTLSLDGLTGKPKLMTMPLSFPTIKLPFGKDFIYIFYIVEICSAVLFGWMDSMYKVTEKRSTTELLGAYKRIIRYIKNICWYIIYRVTYVVLDVSANW